jgi:hypothetical protein
MMNSEGSVRDETQQMLGGTEKNQKILVVAYLLAEP